MKRRHNALPTEQGLIWGEDHAGRPVAMPLGRGHLLVGGATGAGKSGVVNAVLAAAAPRPDIAIVGIDPKRVELQPWSRRCAFVARDAAEIDDALRALLDLMRARYVWMEARGLRMWDTNLGAGGWVLVVLDELAEVFRSDPLARGDSRAAKEHATWRRSVLESLAAVARAVGIVLVSSTQRPAAETIGDEFRANHGFRLCLRVLNDHLARMVLGEIPEGCQPWTIPSDRPGTGELLVDGGRSVRCRARYLDDDAVANVVRTNEHLLAVAGTLPDLLDAVTR